MFKILKQYANINNRNIYAKIITLKRLQKRNILLKFYSENFQKDFDFESSIKYNYFPIYQKLFIFKYFLRENSFFFQSQDNFQKFEQENKFLENSNLFEDVVKLKNNNKFLIQPFRYLINQTLKLRMIDFDFPLNDFFWKKFFNEIFLTKITLFLKKKFIFKRIVNKKWFFIENLFFKTFWHTNFKRKIWICNYEQNYNKLFFKKFFNIYIYCCIKKIKNIQIFFQFIFVKKQNFFFTIPGWLGSFYFFYKKIFIDDFWTIFFKSTFKKYLYIFMKFFFNSTTVLKKKIINVKKVPIKKTIIKKIKINKNKLNFN